MVAIRSPAQAQCLHRASQGIRAWFNRLLHPDTTNALQVYDPAANSWSSGPNLNQQRSFPAGTDVGNTAVAVGGYTGTTLPPRWRSMSRAADAPVLRLRRVQQPHSRRQLHQTATATFTPTATATIHSDGDGDSNVHANSHSNCYGIQQQLRNGHSNDNCDRTAAAYTDATASADTAAACEQLLCKF